LKKDLDEYCFEINNKFDEEINFVKNELHKSKKSIKKFSKDNKNLELKYEKQSRLINTLLMKNEDKKPTNSD